MISDNTVHGDNIYLRELQNFFFQVLGMMSITHYGAIGDGRTDNYGPLQVAIDDAHRRGLSFLYVPYGRYIYTGELINIGDIVFIGNPHAHIVNIRTGVEIEIKQFGWYKVDVGDNYYTKAETNALIADFCASNAITCRASNDVELTSSTGVTIPLTQYSKVGDGITLSDDKIVIGSGISYVRVSGKVTFQTISETAGQRSGNIWKNTGVFAKGAFYCQDNGGSVDYFTKEATIPSIIVPVTEGDTIYLSAQGTNGDKVDSKINTDTILTYITVEAVG